MQIVFKRDEDGHETAHVDGLCIARGEGPHPYDGSGGFALTQLAPQMGIDQQLVDSAANKAEAAGFWAHFCDFSPRFNRTISGGVGRPIRVSECTVEV